MHRAKKPSFQRAEVVFLPTHHAWVPRSRWCRGVLYRFCGVLRSNGQAADQGAAGSEGLSPSWAQAPGAGRGPIPDHTPGASEGRHTERRGSESFIDRDQIDLAGWTGPSVLKGLGNGGQVCASAGGGVLVGESWNLAIYGTGPSAPHLPGQWTLSFRKGLGVRVPVTFQSSGSRDFGFKRSWRPKFSPVLALAA